MNSEKKLMTLCVVHQYPRVLLGMKKRGFGQGRWNGFGGKVHENETIEEAARREMREEARIEADDLNKVAILDFSFNGKPEVLEVHIFRVNSFRGEPAETEEMKPQWFRQDEIPFGEMWPDDIYWFPLFLAGKKFRGAILFGEGDAVMRHELKEIHEALA